jgi:predicted AAA+ superfamily ATPase
LYQLLSRVGSTLTVRSISNKLYALSVSELKRQFGGMHIIQNLENCLIYGMYPELLNAGNVKEKVSYLHELRIVYLNDIGMLWENFMVMERLKTQHYHEIFSNNYFWRTYDQKEVDLVEERDGKLFGYEFKWNANKIKTSHEFLKTYDNASLEVINKDNFLPFLT